MLNRKKVILDVDTGSDDAVAIMLAIRSEELEILGITVTWGNRPVDNCVENTLRVLDLMGRDIPVYKGCPQPMVRYLTRQRNAALDKDGISANIGGQEVTVHPAYLDLPPAVLRAQESHACTFLVETLRNAKEKVTLIPVGPLTNIGMALRMAPEIKENIEEDTQMPNLSMTNVKGLGNIGADARKTLLADAHMKVGEEKDDIIWAFDRECNIIKAFLGEAKNDWKDGIKRLKVTHHIIPFVQNDRAARISELTEATGGKPVMSQQTAVERLGEVKDVDAEMKRLKEEQRAEIESSRVIDVFEGAQ